MRGARKRRSGRRIVTSNDEEEDDDPQTEKAFPTPAQDRLNAKIKVLETQLVAQFSLRDSGLAPEGIQKQKESTKKELEQAKKEIKTAE